MADEPAARTNAPERTVATRVSLDPTRRTIAARLGESYRDAVHVTVQRDIEASALLEADATLEDAGREGSIVDIVLLALSDALTEHPRFNATFDGDALTLYHEHNVAVAVDTDRGLLAPVLDDVRGRSIEAIHRQRTELTNRVIAGDHSMADLSGGTITITNLGPFGIDLFTPIINPPQVAIVSLNRLRRRVVLTDDNTPTAVTDLPVGVTFDHRAVDGADAARLLASMAAALVDADALIAGDG